MAAGRRSCGERPTIHSVISISATKKAPLPSRERVSTSAITMMISISRTTILVDSMNSSAPCSRRRRRLGWGPGVPICDSITATPADSVNSR